MSIIVDSAKILGIHKIEERAKILQRACGRGIHGEVLFYVCGYDYLTAPSDGKFNGLRELFLTRSGVLSQYLNLGNVVGNPWLTIQHAIPLAASGSATNLSQMHKALDIAAERNMVWASLKDLLAGPPASTAPKWEWERKDLSQTLAPYWGDQLSRIGLEAMAAQPSGLTGKVQSFFAQRKKNKEDLEALMNMVGTRGRSARIR